MSEAEVPFILGPYQAVSQQIDIHFKKDEDFDKYEMLRLYADLEDNEAAANKKGYTIHITRYTITVRFREPFQLKEIYERGRNKRVTYGLETGNTHILDVETHCIALIGSIYATLEKELEMIKNHLLYDTFQEEKNRTCFIIQSIVVLNFEIDRLRLLREFGFVRDDADEADADADYSLCIKYSALPSSSTKFVPVGDCIQQFEDITTTYKPYGSTRRNQDGEDFEMVLVMNTQMIAVIVRGDRSQLLKAHAKLHTVFCAYRRAQ